MGLKQFHIGDVLGAYTGVPMPPHYKQGKADVIRHLFENEEMGPHVINDAQADARIALLKQFSWLADVPTPRPIPHLRPANDTLHEQSDDLLTPGEREEELQEFVDRWKSTYGRRLSVDSVGQRKPALKERRILTPEERGAQSGAHIPYKGR